MGVPVLWQDGPVVQFSHFLVSNVQSKVYLLDLDLDLDLVFFWNSNDQIKVLLSGVCRCCVCNGRRKRGAGGAGEAPTQMD